MVPHVQFGGLWAKPQEIYKSNLTFEVMVAHFCFCHTHPLPSTAPRPCLASMTIPGSLKCRQILGRTRVSFPGSDSGNPRPWNRLCGACGLGWLVPRPLLATHWGSLCRLNTLPAPQPRLGSLAPSTTSSGPCLTFHLFLESASSEGTQTGISSVFCLWLEAI